MFYSSVSEIINGLENNKLDFGFIIEKFQRYFEDEYCSYPSNKAKCHYSRLYRHCGTSINTIEKPARGDMAK